MTTPIKTQCPHCRACFNIQKTQLNQADATVRCGHCQQDFLVNKHLIVTTNTAATATNTSDQSDIQPNNSTVPVINNTKQLDAARNDKTSANDQHLEALLESDTLIHDDMDIEESTEASLEYDSLDGMDAWLVQASNTKNPISAESKQQKNNPKTLNKGVDLSAKPSPTAQLTPKTNPEKIEKSTISSVAANDIHASVNSTPDNTWLEELLKEQNESENGTQADNDLAQLLINMGVPIKDEDKANQERSSKIQSRMQSKQIQTRTSIAVLLWTMGCLVLIMLLFAQYVIFNLDTLVKNPAYAARLQTVCSIASCSLPNADLTAFEVIDLDYRTSRSNTTTSSDIQATLNNQSSQVQLLPSLKVSVYGPNVLIGEFIAMPDDYLMSSQKQLAAEGRKQFMFTVPVANDQISQVIITPMY